MGQFICLYLIKLHTKGGPCWELQSEESVCINAKIPIKWILGYLFYPDSLMQKSLISRTKNSHKAGTLGWETFFPSSCRLTTIIFEKQTHLWSLPQTNKGTCQIAFNTDIILEKTDANGIYGHFWYARLMMIIFVVHSILIFYWTGIFWVRIRHKESIFLVLQKMCRWNEQLYIVWDIHGH